MVPTGPIDRFKVGGNITMQCSLCNEAFEQIEIELGEIVTIEDEHWHVACHAEYFDEAFENIKTS